MITRRGFLGLIPGIGLAKGWAGSGSGVPTRKFGRHAEQVSVVGFGGHTLALSKDLAEATRIAHEAVDRGVTFFDNAWCYHKGRGEEWMGHALKGIRDKAFLMTKCCTHQNPLPEGGKEGAMKFLEDSLRRLQTDHVDLWMLHEMKSVAEVEKFYGPGGAAEAFDLAKKQGKVRYLGFTGHDEPEVHLKMIQGGYPFDASLQPVSALGTLHSRRFETEVIPALAEKKIAVIGMKGFGGSKRSSEKGLMTADKVMRYALSYPEVCTHMIGVDQFPYVEQAVLASAQTPMTPEERKAFAAWCDRMGGAEYAMHCQPGHRDGSCCGGPWPDSGLKFVFLVLGYAISMAGSNLLFKVASEKEGTAWWLWFLAGNVAGFGCPVLITYALREQSPHLVYAFTLGAGFVLVQLAGWWFFRSPITLMQMGGLVLTAVGLVMLQLGRA